MYAEVNKFHQYFKYHSMEFYFHLITHNSCLKNYTRTRTHTHLRETLKKLSFFAIFFDEKENQTSRKILTLTTVEHNKMVKLVSLDTDT